MPENYDYLKCPFCSNQSIEAKPGLARCPLCAAQFEIDDRLECVFADTVNLLLPAIGTVCGSCGLIQAGEHQNCLYCGLKINKAVH